MKVPNIVRVSNGTCFYLLSFGSNFGRTSRSPLELGSYHQRSSNRTRYDGDFLRRSLSLNYTFKTGIVSRTSCFIPFHSPGLNTSLPYMTLTAMAKHPRSSPSCCLCFSHPHHAQLSAVLLDPHKTRGGSFRSRRLPSGSRFSNIASHDSVIDLGYHMLMLTMI